MSSPIPRRNHTFVALCSSGLEGAVAWEVKKLGLKVTYSSSGRVFFESPLNLIPRLNLYLKSADRVTVLVSKSKVATFDQLYEACFHHEFTDVIDRNAKISIGKVKVTNSKLSATGAIASVAKKAIVDSLGGTCETGPIYRFIVILKNDELMLLLDTTGALGLSRRGYRLRSGSAPLRETIAASLVRLSRWSNEITLFDPFCGSGTILVEAGLIDVPNCARTFDSEKWGFIAQTWECEKAEAKRRAREILEGNWRKPPRLFGSDIDPKAIEIAKENARRAGVRVNLRCIDFRRLPRFDGEAYVISNLPYGERVASDVLQDARILREKFPNAKFYLLHTSEDFEKYFGRARKRFRFQNGGIWVWAYMYY